MFIVFKKRSIIILTLIIALVMVFILCNRYTKIKSSNKEKTVYDVGEIVSVNSDAKTNSKSKIFDLKLNRDKSRYDTPQIHHSIFNVFFMISILISKYC